MYNLEQAKAFVEEEHSHVTVVDCFRYENLYLVRVERHEPEETNFDPFYSVDPTTGEVKEFSILTDGDPVAIGEAFANRSPKGGE